MCLTLGGVWLVAWHGKHPDPADVFKAAFGVAPPAGTSEMTALRGWFDDSIIVLRFRVEASQAADLVPADAKLLDDLSTMRRTFISPDEDWRLLIWPGFIIDPDLGRRPDWASPRFAQWSRPLANVRRATVRYAWDEQTGTAVAVHSSDP